MAQSNRVSKRCDLTSVFYRPFLILGKIMDIFRQPSYCLSKSFDSALHRGLASHGIEYIFFSDLFPNVDRQMH